MRKPRPGLLALIVASSVAFVLVAAGAHAEDWTTYGYDPANSRTQPFEHDISPANVGSSR